MEIRCNDYRVLFMFMATCVIAAAAESRRQFCCGGVGGRHHNAVTTAITTFVTLSSSRNHRHRRRRNNNSWKSFHSIKQGNDEAITTNTPTPNQQQQQHQQQHSQSKLLRRRNSLPNNISTSTSLSIQNRIQDLISHPAVVWDESSTFNSMHKKKLGRRHLPLFDRSNNALSADDNNHTDETENINSSDSDDDEIATTTTTPHDYLFDQFAQSVCCAGVVARKEVFETWASALYIHTSFLSSESETTVYNTNTNDAGGVSSVKPIRRVADIAAGHGLLAWALLILDDDECQRRRSQDDGGTSSEALSSSSSSSSSSSRITTSPPLTAFCLDKVMPRSAEKIHSAMVRQWPHLEQRFDYVEGRLEQLVPHSSCLLAGVHACGILSDVLVATAAEHAVPLSLVPCCHSRHLKVLEVASPFANDLYEDIILNSKGGSMPDLADRLDGVRMKALENAGMNVKEVFLPSIFTGKNRLIVSFPNTDMDRIKHTWRSKDEHNKPKKKQSATSPMRKGLMPPLDDAPIIMPKSRFLKGFYVPCEDTEHNRRLVSEISGRAAANTRKEVMHNRNHKKSPEFDLSLWLPDDDEEKEEDGNAAAAVELSEDSLSRVVESKHDGAVKCSVSRVGEVYVNPSGRRSQTFRIRYENSEGGGVLPFEDAKAMHGELYDAIPKVFPGAECR